jgi:hypothetical protein
MVSQFPEQPPVPTQRVNGVGMSSLALGFFGLVFFWLVPLGLVLSAAGVVLGGISLFLPQFRTRPGRCYAIGGAVLSLVAFVLNAIIVTESMNLLHFRPQFWPF